MSEYSGHSINMFVLCIAAMKTCFDIFSAIRALMVAVMVIVLSSIVASCSTGVQPFSKSNSPTGKTPPAITVTAMNGMPENKAKVLFDNLAVAAGKRDIAIVRGQFQGGYFMVGEFQALPTADATQVTYRWNVYNAQRQVIHTIANTDTARIGGADPWSGVDPDLLRRIAGFTAESLSTRLNVLGYATRLSGLPPPGQLEWAGPNAHKDIDYETVYGPGAIGPPGAVPSAVATAQPDSQNQQQTAITKPVVTPVKTSVAKKKISAVAMTTVSGSPGKGNRDLLMAMRKVMKNAGWPVLTKPRADALTVTGKVKLDAARGAKQKVAVAWTVRMPDGKVLGTVRQANDVPSGSLDKGWGQAATFASQAAVQGIFKLANTAQ